MQITGKWDNIGAGVEHYAPNPAPACRTGQSLQPPNVAAIQGCTGFYFNAYEVSSRILQHDVHFLSRGRTPTEESRLRLAPCRLLAQLHQRKILQDTPGHSGIQLQSLKSKPQRMREQSGVIQIDLRCPNEPLASVDRPGL